MYRWLALIALCLVVFFVGLGSRALWNQDEGMHAATSKVMAQSGDWVTPTFNGENFYDKPVLFTWLVAGSFRAFGMSEWAARLPAAICGLLGVLGAYVLGRRLFGARPAFLGAVVLATSGGWLVLSRVVVHDISLAAAVVLALAAFWSGYRDETRRWLPWLLFWALSGVAVLAKGPVGLLPPFVAGLFLLGRRELGVVWRMRPVAGPLVLLAVAAPWYVAIALANPDYVEYFLGEKILGSLLDAESLNKAEPFWFYVPVVATQLLPWVGFLPNALLRAWRSRSAESSFLLIWAGSTFVLFSLASAKLGTYILPLLPALALLIGRELAALSVAPEGAARGAFVLPAVIAGVLALVAFGGALGVALERVLELGVPAGAARGLAAFAALGFGTAAWCIARRRVRGCVAATVASIAVLVLGFEIGVAPSMDPYMSARSIGRSADALLPPDTPVSVYQRMEGLYDSALFYYEREARLLAHQIPLREALRRPEPLLVVVREKDFRRLQGRPDLWPLVRVVHREGNKLLVSNRSAEEWLLGWPASGERHWVDRVAALEKSLRQRSP